MRVIPLTQGQHTIVDDEDFERINAHKWSAQKTREGDYYAIRTIWRPGGRNERIYMHREIMNAPSDKEVDHIRGVKLDNRKWINGECNLRVVERKQNEWNKGRRSDNRTGYKGVFFDPAQNHQRTPILCSLKRSNRRVRLGYFATPEEAAKAYDKAALKNDGEFVYLNFPNSMDEYRKEPGLDEAA